MAKMKLQNQEFDIPPEMIALNERIVAEKGKEAAETQRDVELKRWVSQYSPAATNATLSWTEDTKSDGSKETVVRVTPQLGTKGGAVTDGLIEDLVAIPQSVHPVTALTFELKLLQISGQFKGEQALSRLLSYQKRIENVLEHDNGDDGRTINDIARRLRDARPTPSPWAPLGF